jgi:hypothetical protein
MVKRNYPTTENAYWHHGLFRQPGLLTGSYCLEMFSTENPAPISTTIGIVILTNAAFAGVLLRLTIRTFDRCTGKLKNHGFLHASEV